MAVAVTSTSNLEMFDRKIDAKRMYFRNNSYNCLIRKVANGLAFFEILMVIFRMNLNMDFKKESRFIRSCLPRWPMYFTTLPTSGMVSLIAANEAISKRFNRMPVTSSNLLTIR
jgi:hypothetical protein